MEGIQFLGTLEEKVDPAHAAIIVVDVQNDFCAPDGYYHSTGADLSGIRTAVERLRAFLDIARKSGVMTVYVRSHYDPIYLSPVQIERRQRLGWEMPLCQEGTWGADFFMVRPAPGDPVVTKHRFDAFFRTNLDLILRSNNRKSLIFGGVATNICVESALRSAFVRDYYVVLLEDCTSARTPEFHQATLETVRAGYGVVEKAETIERIWQDISRR